MNFTPQDLLKEREAFLIFCTGSNPADGPDYTMADVAAFCRGWEPAE